MKRAIFALAFILTLSAIASAAPYCSDPASPYYCEQMDPIDGACRTYADTAAPEYATTCLNQGCCCSGGSVGYPVECPYAFAENPSGDSCSSVCESIDLLDTLAPGEIVPYESLFDEAADANAFTRRLNEGYEHLSVADQQQMIADLDVLLETREDLVIDSLLTNPGVAQHLEDLSLHPELEAETDAETLASHEIDRDTSIRGYPVVFMAAFTNDAEPTRLQYIVSEDSEEWYYVSTQNPTEVPINPKDPIEMSGTSFQELMAVEDIEIQEGSPARYTFYEHASGDVRTLVGRLTVGDASPGITIPQLDDIYLGDGPYSVKDFYADSSYGRTNVLGRVADISIGELRGCGADATNWDRIQSLLPLAFATLRELAAEAGGLTEYDSFVVAGPGESETCLTAFGTIGALRINILGWEIIDASLTYLDYPNGISYGDSKPRQEFDTPAHEFGHNLGLGHAARYECLDEAGRYAPISQNCWRESYQDFDSIMGGTPVGPISPYGRYFLGWLSNYNVAVADMDGPYEIYSSTLAPESDREHLLLVPISNGVGEFRGTSYSNLYYAIALRPGNDTDYTNTDNPHYGVTISLAELNEAGWKWSEKTIDEMLIDMRTLPGRDLGETQASDGYPWHQLLEGETFTDPYNGLSITLENLERYPDRARIRVERGPIAPSEYADPVFDYDFTQIDYPTIPDQTDNDLDIYYHDITYTDQGISTSGEGLDLPRMTHNLLKQSNSFTILSTYYLPDTWYNNFYSFGFTELRVQNDELRATTKFDLNDLERVEGRAPWIEQHEKASREKRVLLTSGFEPGWNHIAVVYGSGVYELYLNGELVAKQDLEEGHWSITLDQASPPTNSFFIQKLRARHGSVIQRLTGYRRALSPEEISALAASTPTEPPIPDENPRIDAFSLDKDLVVRYELFNASWQVYPDPVCHLTAEGPLGGTTYRNMPVPEGEQQLRFDFTEYEYGMRDITLTCGNSADTVSETDTIEYVECTEDHHCTSAGALLYAGACILNSCEDADLIDAPGSPDISLDVGPVVFVEDGSFSLSYDVGGVDLSTTDFCAGEGMLGSVAEASVDAFAARGPSGTMTIDTSVLGENLGPKELEIVCGNEDGFTRASVETILGECTEADVSACSPAQICHEFECKEPGDVTSGCVCEPDSDNNEIRLITIDYCPIDEAPLCGPLSCACADPATLPSVTVEASGVDPGDGVEATLWPSGQTCMLSGTTPCTINGVIPGPYTLHVDGIGYYEKTQPADVDGDTTLTIDIEQVPYPPPTTSIYGYQYRYRGLKVAPYCVFGCWVAWFEQSNTHPGGLDQTTNVRVRMEIPIQHVDGNTVCTPVGFSGSPIEGAELTSGSGTRWSNTFDAGTVVGDEIGYECTNDAGTRRLTRPILVKP